MPARDKAHTRHECGTDKQRVVAETKVSEQVYRSSGHKDAPKIVDELSYTHTYTHGERE